jgi:hypothetical protein
MPERRRLRTPPDIRRWITQELVTSRASDDPWPALERAHIVSQPWPWPHTRVHAAMLRAALAQRDRREVIGQVVRIVLAGPGSLVGRYATGNTGRTSMGLTETKPVPVDLVDPLP